MNYTKKILAVLTASALTLPAFSCKKNESSAVADGSTASQTVGTIQLDTDQNMGVKMELDFKEIEGDGQASDTEPSATLVSGTDGSLYVQKTDINNQPITQENGSAATELYTGTTIATQLPDPGYTPAYKTYFSMWLDTTKKSDFVFNGEFLEFDVKILEGAKDGVYSIQLYKDDFSNYESQTLKVTKNPGYICVNAAEPAPVHETGGDLTLSGSVVSGKPGDTVKFIVNIENNSGITGFRLWMSYDSNAIKIIRAGAGKDFKTDAGLDGKTVTEGT